MKERPILFSGEMVRAILEGRKTMTRRVVKVNGDLPKTITDRSIVPYNGTGEQLQRALNFAGHKCKYGEVGDRLWVKETFFNSRNDDTMPTYYRADQFLYGPADWQYHQCPWKPSIFMPRWASRITLEIVSVMVERLQDISEDEAKAEGIKQVTCGLDETCFEYARNENAYSTAKQAFEALWKKINGAESWVANPWVWVIEFKKVEVAK
jgi:hypothetical protein